jgi:hypothetical protein
MPFIHCALRDATLIVAKLFSTCSPNPYSCLTNLASTLTQGYENTFPTARFHNIPIHHKGFTTPPNAKKPKFQTLKISESRAPLSRSQNAPPQTHGHNPNRRGPLRLRRPPGPRSPARRTGAGTGAGTGKRRGVGDATEDAECGSGCRARGEAGAGGGEEEDARGEVGDYWGEGLIALCYGEEGWDSEGERLRGVIFGVTTWQVASTRPLLGRMTTALF